MASSRIEIEERKMIESMARSLERLSLLTELRELTFVPASMWTTEMEDRHRFIMRHLGWGVQRRDAA